MILLIKFVCTQVFTGFIRKINLHVGPTRLEYNAGLGHQMIRITGKHIDVGRGAKPGLDSFIVINISQF